MDIILEPTKKSYYKAARQLEEYAKELAVKTERLRERLANEIKEEAERNFENAETGTSFSMKDGKIQQFDGNKILAEVSITKDATAAVITATGSEILFVEFGAGVFYNGAAGSSPHPEGQTTGMTIGSYGQGKGKQKTWGYYDNNGNLKFTKGTKAQLPFYKAVLKVCENYDKIVKEVFDDDN